MLNLLILGGTSEAASLVRQLPKDVAPITSWAGRTKTPPNLPGDVRIGGFNGADGLATYLRENAIDAVIDATHPFAAQISKNAAEACEKTGVPRLLLERPAWKREKGDNWIMANDLADAAGQLPTLGKRPFLTIGRQHLDAFTGITEVHFIVRLLAPPQTPLALPNHQIITGKPPFSLNDERQLIRDHTIDLLVTKESGGLSTYAKIEAARLEKIPVLMVKRPAPPPGETADSIEAALNWIAAL